MGVRAKSNAHIHATKLPPRTPSLMPLDYPIWQRVVNKAMDGAPDHTERKDDLLARLRSAAKSLPRGYVRSVVAQMKGRTQALIASKGFTPKHD